MLTGQERLGSEINIQLLIELYIDVKPSKTCGCGLEA